MEAAQWPTNNMIRLGAPVTVLPDGEDSLPREFRLFCAGKNETQKGTFVFDEDAAASVMSDYRARNVRLMIDLEHGALDAPIRADSQDARGWCDLELRDGELWAVNVRWTEDGARRLRERTQCYISPAFLEAEGRIVSLLNVALVAMPATHSAAPLVAASIARTSMNPDMVKKALEALRAGDAEATMALLEELIAAAASGGEMPPDEETPEGEALAEAPDEEEEPEEKMMAAALRRATGASTAVDAIAALSAMREQVRALEAEQATIRAERLAVENTERRRLVAELVKLGYEVPATAWADDEKQQPVQRLANEPIAELRARVAAYRQAPHRELRAPVPDNKAKLSAEDEALAKNMTEAQKQRFIQLRAARRKGEDNG